jgi:predicted hydrocarbon binding protein
MTKKIELSALEYLTLAYGNIIFVIDALSKHFGRGEVLEALREAVVEEAEDRGKRMANYLGGNSIEDFIKHETQELYLPPELRDHNLMEWEIVEKEDDKLQIKVTRCLFADAFQELGDTDLGYVLSCEQDFRFAEGFNPKMKLERTKTLMEGHDFCDHCWKIIEKEEE